MNSENTSNSEERQTSAIADDNTTITIVIDNTIPITVFKSKLLTNSSYFSNMFLGNYLESHSATINLACPLPIEDEVIVYFISWLGLLNNSLPYFTSEVLIKFLALADYFKISDSFLEDLINSFCDSCPTGLVKDMLENYWRSSFIKFDVVTRIVMKLSKLLDYSRTGLILMWVQNEYKDNLIETLRSDEFLNLVEFFNSHPEYTPPTGSNSFNNLVTRYPIASRALNLKRQY